MAAMRGARLLCNIGKSTLRIGGHQRRINSLALPALAQCSSRNHFKGIQVLPVNKYDLKGLGIITTTSPSLFSTESFEALSEDSPSNSVDEDNESGMERKWPSPITQVQQHSNTAFVGGYDLDLKELPSILSQFGTVKKLEIPRINESLDSNVYCYGFVDFVSQESLIKALETGSVTTADNKVIEIKPRTKSRRAYENERTFVIRNLPDDIIIDHIHDYFKSFGSVKLINLVINSSKASIAFVLFDMESNIDGLELMAHEIGNHKVSIEKVDPRTRRQRRDRAKKVIIEGVQDHLDEDRIKTFFDTEVKDIYYLKNAQTGFQSNLVVVTFDSYDAAKEIAAKKCYDIDGCIVNVRRLGLISEA